MSDRCDYCTLKAYYHNSEGSIGAGSDSGEESRHVVCDEPNRIREACVYFETSRCPGGFRGFNKRKGLGLGWSVDSGIGEKTMHGTAIKVSGQCTYFSVELRFV